MLWGVMVWGMQTPSAQIPVAQAPASAVAPAGARPCPETRSGAPQPKKGPRKGAAPATGTASCIELPLSALDVQEYLQAYSREKHWMIVQDQVTEDSWNFSVALTQDELAAATKDAPQSVQWRSGIGMVQISSTTLNDGFTRTVVHAHFRRYGESSDQFATQKEYWDLPSNGSFEDSLATALKAHFEAQAK